MFRFTREPSSGSHSQYLAKITHLVKSGYVELVQYVVSVMTAYCDLWGVCAVHSNVFSIIHVPWSGMVHNIDSNNSTLVKTVIFKKLTVQHFIFQMMHTTLKKR